MLVLDYDYEDDDEDDKTKNLQTPAKRRMKASHESCRKPFDRLASSFSLTEKSAITATVADRRYNDRDEHSQTGILTSASNLIPPSRSAPRTSGLGNL